MATTRRDLSIMRFGAMSFLSNAGVVLLLWLVLFWSGTRSSLSGVNGVTGTLVWITTAVPATLLVLANLAFARQLMAARRERAATLD